MWEVIYDVSHEKTLWLTREVKLNDIYESKRLQQRALTETKEAVVDYWMGHYFEKIDNFMPDREKNTFIGMDDATMASWRIFKGHEKDAWR